MIAAVPVALAGAWALAIPVAGGYGLALGASALAVWAAIRNSSLSRRLREAEAAMARGVAERREIERTLADQKQRLKMVIESEPECVKLQTADGTILDMNPAGLAIIEAERREDIVGKSAYGYIAPEWRAKYAEMTERVFRGETASLEFRLIARSGMERWMKTHAVPLRDRDGSIWALLGFTRNITDRRIAEEHERQHRTAVARLLRMHSMGEMATTIAHELNQPLTAIINYSRGAIRRLRSAQGSIDEVIDSLEAASIEADRAARIIRNIRNFLRKEPTPRQRHDLNEVLRGVFAFMQAELRRQAIGTSVALAEGLPRVEVVPIEIEQVILNLVRNAIEAMAGTSGRDKELSVATRCSGANGIEVTISDTGPGLPPREFGDVFDPFVTSKPDGLGMGLAIARSIVDAHGGRIGVERTSIHGTTFVLSLPAAAAD
ncbi:MAG: PAS domain-containing protein [Betaproteobacteria bacterium]|nr:PAS domain-containing protein [Betaproteobacteria bacterium]